MFFQINKKKRVDHTMIVFGNAVYIFAGTNQKNIFNDLYKINLGNFQFE